LFILKGNTKTFKENELRAEPTKLDQNGQLERQITITLRHSSDAIYDKHEETQPNNSESSMGRYYRKRYDQEKGSLTKLSLTLGAIAVHCSYNLGSGNIPDAGKVTPE
jgi:hypothetical protein